MRPILLLPLIALSFASCATYQYVTLNAPDMTQNERKELVWENDTMKVVYNFNGHSGPMNMSIYNKTDKPLFVNWKKSALIRNSQSTSLFNREVIVTGEAATVSAPARGHSYNVSFTGFAASFDLPEGTDFIPPAANFNKNLLAVMPSGAVSTTDIEPAKTEQATNWDGAIAKYKRVTFDERQSPVQFTNYLTFALGLNGATEFAVKHTFYIKEILQSKEEPEMFSLYNKDGNKLYTVQHAQ